MCERERQRVRDKIVRVCEGEVRGDGVCVCARACVHKREREREIVGVFWPKE